MSNTSLFHNFLSCFGCRDQKPEVFLASGTSIERAPPLLAPREFLAVLLKFTEIYKDFHKIVTSEMSDEGDTIYGICHVVEKKENDPKRIGMPFLCVAKFHEGLITGGSVYADIFPVLQRDELLSSESPPLPLLEPELPSRHVNTEGFLGDLSRLELPFVVLNSDGKIVSCNNALCSLLGEEQLDLVGSVFTDHLAPESRAAENRMAQMLEQHSTVSVRESLQLKTVLGPLSVSTVARSIHDEKDRRLSLRLLLDLPQVDALIQRNEETLSSLGREIHDGLAQDAAALWFCLQDSALNTDLCRELAHRLRSETARLSDESLRHRFSEESLSDALENLRSRMAKECGLLVELRDDARGVGNNPVSYAAFRIVQESLTNVVKHAKVTDAVVEIKVESNCLKGQVSDRGTGAPSGPPKPTQFGLTVMKERCTALGGLCSVHMSPGKGTRVDFEIPLPQKHCRMENK